MSELTSSLSSQSASWFEFLLNPALLDTFLTADNLEIAGTDLIIQFLISANLIEQKTKPKTGLENPNDIELKDNRIRALRHLAMKIAAKLNWDLVIIERRIPVAVASDLIHCFVRLTTQSEKSYKDREQLQQLNKLDEPALFAVQLLHRWTVRTCVQSSFPLKPVKIFQVNVAGYVNPLQHMRVPNENVIQMARAKVRESVQALETLLEWKSVVRLPLEACFGLIDIEHGIVPCDWSRTQIYPLVECLARISYDLGSIYFHEQNYVNAYTMFRRVSDVRTQLEASNYFVSLEGYLTSLQSINPSMEHSLLNKPKDRLFTGALPLRASMDDYISVLGEDNDSREISIAARVRLEDRLDVGSQQHKIVCSFNLVRSLLEGKQPSNTHFAFDYLETALQRIKQITPKQQSLLNSFLRIHFHNLTKNLQEQLRADKLSHLIGPAFSVLGWRSHTQSQQYYRSNLLERPNGSKHFKCYTRLLHSSEPEVLMQAINDLDTAKLAHTLPELFPSSSVHEPIDKPLNVVVKKDLLLGQFIRILHLKAKRAKQCRNYVQSRKLLAHAVEILSPLLNQDLTIGKLVKHLRYERLLFDLNETILRQTFADSDNDLWIACRNFLTDNQSENDASVEVTRVTLAFALNRGEIQFLQGLMPTARRNRHYLELAKLFARLLTNDGQSQMLQLRPELARELWERILDILADKLPGSSGKQSRNRQQQQQQQSGHPLPDRLSAIHLQKFLQLIYHPLLIQILFSLLTRVYSLVLVEQSHIDIFSEYARYWPTALDYRQRSIRVPSIAQLVQTIIEHIQTLKLLPPQIKASLLRTQADLHLTLQQHTQAMHAYINSIAIDTALFSSTAISQQDDLMTRNMIKATLQLGYHTQVACLCQLLSLPDYNIIFKTLQENYMNDDIDDYYECIWDLALMESLINNLNIRGYEDKKKLAIRACKQKDLNGNNAEEMRFKMIRVKKRFLFKKLLAHYMLPYNRLYRSRTMIKVRINFD